MEHENTSGLTSREDACIKVKQIAEAIKKLKINNYLKIGGMSAEDKEKINMLFEQMHAVAQTTETGKSENYFKEYLNRYDSEPTNSNVEILDLYRGAIDAEVAFLKVGKIKRAKKCQGQANLYMEKLDSENEKTLAIEYKRKAFLGLTVSLDNIKEDEELWKNKFKGCLRPKDFSDRKKIIDYISTVKENSVNEKDNNISLFDLER